MRYFSMFSGIGGFELGIQRASPQARCIGHSEIDKYAIKVYERNFDGHINHGDATRIDPPKLLPFDTLVGGFPCQAFSIAGRRAGFGDTRGTLFFDIARVLAQKRPRHLVLENVKGLLSHDGGKTFQTILRILSELGYRVEWQVLNSKDSEYPKTESECSLSDILEENVDEKYYLSSEVANKLLVSLDTSAKKSGQTGTNK